MSYTMYTPLNVWLDPASVTDVVAYIQTYLSENTIYSEEEIEELIHDYLIAHPELIGGVQSVNGKTGTVVLTASDINTTNNTTIQAVINSLSADISAIVQSVTNEATARSNADTELSGRITTNATGITNEATARANADTALGNRITALQGAVGSPLVASTASAMTETSKIYVYTGSETGYTNGNWYYYNGTAWTSGGVYNAVAINTDTTLTVAGMAADAKATGDGLNDLKSAIGEEQAKYITDDVSNTATANNNWINTNGVMQLAGSSTNSVVIDVEPNTSYFLCINGSNRSIFAESQDDFVVGNSYTVLQYTTPYLYRGSNVYYLKTSAVAKKLIWYFYSGIRDNTHIKDDLIASKNFWTIDKSKYLNPIYYRDRELSGGTALIFGDSISETCNITINNNKETTAYSWKIPNNSYNNNGVVIAYSMWAQILRDNQNMLEIRNYAQSGASFKTSERQAGQERQNVQYQIDVAINDKNNPNNVFSVSNFNPNVIIFALGINDGVIEDSFDTAMQATVYESDGITINVPATISALDDTKTISSARKAILRVRQAFPLAQIFCVLPLQTANSDSIQTKHDELKKLYNHCGCIVIDGATESGITREFEVENGMGLFLKDGLHPNEKGQNLLARLIISKIKANFIPYLDGFNVI